MALEPFDLINVHRRSYTAPLAIDLCTTNGTVTNGSDGGGGVAPPQIILNATGALEHAQTNEYFNQDPWSYRNSTADGMWGLRNVISATLYVTGATTNSPTAGTWSGISFGAFPSQFASAGTPTETQAVVFLALDISTATYKVGVINKYGPSTHKSFITDVGLPSGFKAFAEQRFYKLTIDYRPDELIDFYVDDRRIYRWRDSVDAKPYTPLADFKANEKTVGLTLRGGNLFSTVGNAAHVNSTIFTNFECYTLT